MRRVRSFFRVSDSLCSFLLAASLVMVAACGGGEKGSPDAGHEGGHESADKGGAKEKEAVAVEVEQVVRQPLSQLYSTSATLRADKRATVIARTQGIVRRLLVEEGDTVRSGQELVELEDDEQRIATLRARTTRDTRVRELERVKELFDQKLVPEEEFEAKGREAEDAEQAMALAELELARTVIRSPFAGMLLHRHLDVGATVSDGTAIFDLADLDPLYADINVPERHVIELSAGQTVRLTADASELSATATIERISPAVDPSSGTVKVTLAVEPTEGLRPGSFVRASIVTDTRDTALVVPRSALVAEGRRWHLYRVEEGGTTVRQLEVEIGYEEGDRVEIAGVIGEGSIEEGDRVVTAGAAALADEAAIRIVEGDGSDGAA